MKVLFVNARGNEHGVLKCPSCEKTFPLNGGQSHHPDCRREPGERFVFMANRTVLDYAALHAEKQGAHTQVPNLPSGITYEILENAQTRYFVL